MYQEQSYFLKSKYSTTSRGADLFHGCLSELRFQLDEQVEDGFLRALEEQAVLEVLPLISFYSLLFYLLCIIVTLLYFYVFCWLCFNVVFFLYRAASFWWWWHINSWWMAGEEIKPRSLGCGAPQESTLSLLIFNLYIKLLGKIIHLHRFCISCYCLARNWDVKLSIISVLMKPDPHADGLPSINHQNDSCCPEKNST